MKMATTVRMMKLLTIMMHKEDYDGEYDDDDYLREKQGRLLMWVHSIIYKIDVLSTAQHNNYQQLHLSVCLLRNLLELDASCESGTTSF